MQTNGHLSLWDRSVLRAAYKDRRNDQEFIQNFVWKYKKKMTNYYLLNIKGY